MLSSGIVYCEMCGRPIERRRAKIVYIEGARLTLCPECYTKVSRRIVTTEVRAITQEATKRPKTQVHTKTYTREYGKRRRRLLEGYEVVPDYAERVRKAREKLGWTQRMLAEAVKESENVIKRIESGRLVPSIDLAERLERVLGIKLLEPIVEEVPQTYQPRQASNIKELTLGDIVTIRKKEGKKH